MRSLIFSVVSSLALLGYSVAANAHEDQVLFNVVQLQASVERDIPNEEMLVVMVTEHQGRSPAELVKEVNADMDWALATVRKQKEISSHTRSYHTYPIYKEQTIVGWQSSQELELKSKSVAELTDLVGELQSRMQVRQMTFIPIPETRTQHINELIEQAIAEFKRRAEIIRRHMDGKDYRIVNINIGTDDFLPQQIRYRAAEMSFGVAAGSAPAVEAGTSKVTVTVNGSIQFF